MSYRYEKVTKAGSRVLRGGKIQARRKAAALFKKAHDARLSLMDPQFNLREIAKQMLLLEDHLLHRNKHCPDCIRKHLMTIEAFAEEATSLDREGKYRAVGESMAEAARKWLIQVTEAKTHTELAGVAQSIRSVRKDLVSKVYDPRKIEACKRVAAAAMARQPCTHTAASMTLYHGTTQVFDKFRLDKSGRRDSGNLGRGVYLTKDPTFAMRYAEENARKWGEEPVVLKVRANLRKVAPFYKMVPRIKSELGAGFPPKSQDPRRSETLRLWFMEQGYDAAEAGNEIVVFDPRKLQILGQEHVRTEQDRMNAILQHFQDTGEVINEQDPRIWQVR